MQSVSVPAAVCVCQSSCESVCVRVCVYGLLVQIRMQNRSPRLSAHRDSRNSCQKHSKAVVLAPDVAAAF